MKEKIHYQFRYRASVLAVASSLAFASLSAQAASMGKITVFSGLGQPLRAEVNVSGSNEELTSMAVRLASPEAFDQAGIYYGAALKDLRFNLEKKGSGQGIIKISSSRPVNDPFLDFLVELNWSSGRLVREYTFLLDPLESAGKNNNRPVAVVDPKSVAQPNSTEIKPAVTPVAVAKPVAVELAPAPVVPVAKLSEPEIVVKPLAEPVQKTPVATLPKSEPAPLPVVPAPAFVEVKPLKPQNTAEARSESRLSNVGASATTMTQPSTVAANQSAASTNISGEGQLWPPAPGKRLSSMNGGANNALPTSAAAYNGNSSSSLSARSGVLSESNASSIDARSEARLWPPEDKRAANTKSSTTTQGSMGIPAPSNSPAFVTIKPLDAKSKNSVLSHETQPIPTPVMPAGSDGGDTHRVARGETLGRIAAQNLPQGVSLEQMLVSLYRQNSSAFIGNNINRLRTGAVLTIPDKETASSISRSEARKAYRARVAEWHGYRHKLATAAAEVGMRATQPAQASGGKVTGKVEDKTPAPATNDQVQVSRTNEVGKGGKPSAAEKKAIAAEEAAIAAKQLKELKEKEEALKKSNEKLQKLTPEVQAKPPVPEPLKPSTQKPSVPPVTEPPPPPVEVKPPVQPPVQPPAQPPVAEQPPVQTPQPPVPPVVETPPPPPPPPVEVKPPSPPPVPPQVEEVGMVDEIIDSLTEDPLPIAAGGGVLAALLGFFAYRRRQQQQPRDELDEFSEAPFTDEPQSSVEPSSIGPTSVFHSVGGQSVNTTHTPPPLTDFSQAGPGTIDTDEVDPVAEADVYIAYGRDAQAEEILVEALQKDPQRAMIYLKLLEIYANRKDGKQFETIASELYAQTGGKGQDWEKAAALGLTVDPSNPLYRGKQMAAAVPPAPPPPIFEAPKTPVVAPPAPPVVEKPFVPPPPPPPPKQEEVFPAAKESNSLDFDFATATPSPTPATPVVAAPPPPMPPATPPVLTPPSPPPVVPPVQATEAAWPPPPVFNAPQAPVEPKFMPLAGSEPVVPVPPPVPKPVAPTPVTPPAPPVMPVAPAVEKPATPPAKKPDFATATLTGSVSLRFNQPTVTPTAQKAATAETNFTPEGTLIQTRAVPKKEEPAVEENIPNLDFDFGGSSKSGVELEATQPDPFNFDLQLPEVTEEAVNAGKAVDSAADFDLSSITLDLESTHIKNAQLMQQAGHGPHWEEVNTKLDLAKAYQEMGDMEGAKELLQEVLNEGEKDQIAQAKSMLADLGVK